MTDRQLVCDDHNVWNDDLINNLVWMDSTQPQLRLLFISFRAQSVRKFSWLQLLVSFWFRFSCCCCCYCYIFCCYFCFIIHRIWYSCWLSLIVDACCLLECGVWFARVARTSHKHNIGWLNLIGRRVDCLTLD